MLTKIKFKGDLSRVNEEEKALINAKLENFMKKHEIDFSEVHLNLELSKNKETSRGRTSYEVKINIDSDRGRYHADNTDFGAEKTISATLAKLDRQIMKKRG